MSDENWHDVFAYEDLEEFLPERVDAAGVKIALYKIGSDVFATQASCSHAEADLCNGYVEGDIVECPLHQARFHIPTGKVLSEPADTDLSVYLVRVDNGRVLVRVDA